MNLSRKNKILIALLLLAGAAYFAYTEAYKPHKTLDQLEIKFTGNAQEFSEKVKQDATAWQDVVVQLTGKVTSIDTKGFTLNDNIYCQASEAINLSEVKKDTQITIKGRMIGYDDLLEEIKLDKTIILK